MNNNYNNGLEKFVSKNLENKPNSLNTSIDWIVYYPIKKNNEDKNVGKYRVEVLTVLPDKKYVFDLPDNKEIKKKGIEKKIVGIFKQYEDLITSIKYGFNKKTLSDIVISKQEYNKIMKQKEKEYLRRAKSKKGIRDLIREREKDYMRVYNKQLGSPVRWL